MIRIKICGMKQPGNIRDIAALSPEFLGLIFYAKSPRNAIQLDPKVLRELLPETRVVGVFVNETPYNIRKIAARFGLTFLQLHGNESPAACDALEKDGFTVIKAFPIATSADFEAIKAYEDVCSYALLDTKTGPSEQSPGGTGQTFDWGLLQHYHSSLPFFLSGGICPDNPDAIKKITHPMFYAVDINSRFETSPGIKSPELVAPFLREIRKTRHK